MKLLHLSDLHLGRSLHRFSLEEEQRTILEAIVRTAALEQPDAVLIAGDVYDRGIPPIYATRLLDTFLDGLTALGIPVCLISGNHDSAERLSFLSGPLKKSGLYLSPIYDGQVAPVTLCDAEGPVDVWLLPFLRPAAVRAVFPDEPIDSTNDAVACALRHLPIDPSRRNVLVAHQFVSGASVSGSEGCCELSGSGEVIVGGSDLVDAHLFDAFDYVALGHLHRAQNVGSERIRYCGTPMRYSFSEMNDEKSVTVAELSGDRSLTVRCIPLPAPRGMQRLRGTFAQITDETFLQAVDRDAYTHVVLTDDEPIFEVMNQLRLRFPNITHLDWDNARTRHLDDFSAVSALQRPTPLTLFSEFYERTTGAAMSSEQIDYLDRLIREIWEVDACDR